MMMRLILVIGMIMESLQIEGTLFILADDNLTQITVNDNDYTTMYNTSLGYKEQSAIVDIYPGDKLTIKVWSIYGGLYLSTRFVTSSYTMLLTNKYFALWTWDLATPIGVKVLGPTTFVGENVKPYAVFTATIPFPGACNNYKGIALQKETVTIDISSLFSPLITFTGWYSRLPIIFDEINANGKCLTDLSEEIILLQEYRSETIQYVPIDVETSTLTFKFHFNDYTNDNIECSIELVYCYKSCGSCVSSGDRTNNNCLTCLPGYDADSTNCISLCDGSKWYEDEVKTICVNECPYDYPLFIQSTLECVASCPSSHPFAILSIKECASSCPPEYPLLTSEKNSCDISCPDDYPYQIELEKQCVNACPPNYPIVFNSGKQCLDSCLNNDLYQYDNSCVTKEELKDIAHIKENKTDLSDFVIDSDLKDFLGKVDGIVEIIDFINGKLKGQDFIAGVIPPVTNSLSTIDLNECGNILKKTYGIPLEEELRIMIIDGIKEGSQISEVQFFVYDQQYHCLNLSYCNDLEITIKSFILPNSTIDWAKYQNMMDQGINICNPEDSFFNDICYPYSEAGLDMTLSDRRTHLYQNVSLCGVDCVFQGINFTTNQSICNCAINNNRTDIKEVISLSFLNSIPSSNFLIAKCYFRLFVVDDLVVNLSFWIILVLLLLFIISFVHFEMRGLKHLYSEMNRYPSGSHFLQDTNDAFYENLHGMSPMWRTKRRSISTRHSIDLFHSRGTNIRRNTVISSNPQEKQIRRNSLISRNANPTSLNPQEPKPRRNSLISRNANPISLNPQEPKPRRNSRNGNPISYLPQEPQIRRNSLISVNPQNQKIRRNSLISLNPQDQLVRRTSLVSIPEKQKVRRNSQFNMNFSQYHQIRRSSQIQNDINQSSINSPPQCQQVKRNSLISRNKILEIVPSREDNNTNNINEQGEKQLSSQTFTQKKQQQTLHPSKRQVDCTCPYTLALRTDKRNVFAMYWQILTRNYMFFQPFFDQSPYDLVATKLQILILTIVTELALNALFFSDDIVSEKYNKAGQLLLISSILKSIYSSMLNSICISFLEKVAEFQLLLERIEKEYQVQNAYLFLVKKAVRTIKLKMTCFFICGVLLILFCWYYCTLFCIIYHGNQVSLFTDEVISLLLASAFSFAVNFLIALLRYCALRIESRNMYYTAIYFTRFF